LCCKTWNPHEQVHQTKICSGSWIYGSLWSFKPDFRGAEATGVAALRLAEVANKLGSKLQLRFLLTWLEVANCFRG
jgi:hypothetical protein